jgi:pantoate--beta-alanine ligase
VTPLRSVAALRAATGDWRRAGLRYALVPTMGALHEGHVTLVRHALSEADRVVVSIFVNPTQFAPSEDFAAYPRQEAADLAALAAAGAQAVYLPSLAEIYPDGFATRVTVAGLTDGLCGPLRPGHFDGVATVVTKLLLQAAPDLALFGEKDYQQLQVIRRLVQDLDIPVRIVGVPTVREADGLAMSSRNAYLTPPERALAPQLYRLLQDSGRRLQTGGAAAVVLPAAIQALATAGFGAVDYVALCDAETLAPLDRLDRPARLLAAVRLGRARLIDNIAVLPISQ